MCGKIDLADVTVQFLYFAPGQDTPAASAPATIKIDTVGPLPPSGLSTLPGNKRIVVNWKNISGGDPDAGTTGGATSTGGIRMYCDPDSTSASTEPVCTDVPVASDAGDDAGDAGTTTTQQCSDAGTKTVDCGSSHLTDPAQLDNFLCGENASSTGTTVASNKPLENGKRYAIAVAATDVFDNAGAVSQILCETPAETTDFWDDYRKAGGGAGGGCATGGSDVPLGTAAAGATLVALVVTSLGRRRKRR
jgi:hypothetical protein